MSPEKPQYSAFPWKACPKIMATLIDGAKKHGWRNWQKRDKQFFLEAYLRHHMDFMTGVEFDKDSGHPPLWHAAANLVIYMDLETREEEVKQAAYAEREKQNTPDFLPPEGFNIK